MLLRTWMLVLLTVTWTASADDKSGDGDEDLGVGLKMAFRLYDECERRGDTLAVCLKMRAVNLLDRAMRLPEIPLGESVLLVRSSEEDDATGGSRGASQDDLADRSGNPDQREARVDRALMDRVARFISSHRLQLTLPRLQGEDLERGVEEGRGKMKKMMGMMMGMASKMAGLIPAAIAGLFLLAGKALIVSKMALVLILVIALKKIVAQRQSEGGHHYEMAHGWQGGHGGGGHGGGGHGGADWDRRSLAAHRMAYRAQHRPRAAGAGAAAAKEKAVA